MMGSEEQAEKLALAVLDALEQGELATGWALSQQALAHVPDSAMLWNLAGLCARQMGRDADTVRCWHRAIELVPSADLCNRLGEFLLNMGMYDEAESVYRVAEEAGFADQRTADGLAQVASDRKAGITDAGTWNNIGLVRMQLGQQDGAEQAYRAALALQPDDAAAHTNLGLLLESMGRLDEALQHQRGAQRAAPASVAVLCHLADLLSQMGHEHEAERLYRDAIRIDPTASIPHSNLGVLYFDTNRMEQAEAEYRTALALRPDSTSAQLNLAQFLLSVGRLEEGWPYHEVRYAMRTPGAMPAFPETAVAARHWQGEPLQGLSLLVWPEQGFGDQVQFCRYLALLRELGPVQLTLVCSKPLRRLFKTLDGPHTVLPSEEGASALQQHDFWVPMLSLPLRFGTDLHNMPASVPYLFAEAGLVHAWAERFASAAAGLRVGIAWRGNSRHANDNDRSLPSLATLRPLWDVSGISIVSLQKVVPADEPWPAPGQALLPLGAQMGGFEDTAAIIAGLDLVITVDTAVAHLAGAMNKPCWLLLPFRRCDWRWIRGRTDSPWYPTMRIFRQPARHDWATPVLQVQAALKDFTPPAASPPAYR